MFSRIIYGRRSLELQKWRNLRVSLNPLQNASSVSNSFSSASAADVSPRDGKKEQNFSISYHVDSLVFTAKLAESISRKVSLAEKSNPDSVMSILRSYGFTDSQISNIITTYPQLLTLDSAKKSIGPKLQFLQSRGASSSELTDVLSKAPKILGMKGDITISRHYDFVKEIIEADKSCKFEKICHSWPEGSKQENKIRNVLILRELGVPQRLLFSLLTSISPHICGKENFDKSLKKVVEMGIDPTTAKFVQALRAVRGLSDKTIEEKINVYKRLGFDEGDVWAMFKKWPYTLTHSEKKILNSIETFLSLGITRDEILVMIKRFPSCLNSSGELVKKKIEFLVKKMDWPVKAVALCPQVLGFSMEKRIVPRCNVIKALMSKGLLGDRGSQLPSMVYVLTCTDHDFLKRYVRKHEDKELVAELMAMFTSGRVSLNEQR